ncbi:MAG: type II secretion system protein GspG [Phycisphaerae bacterium]|nr:type II secretion system protein GspG [Phycisphaerae bacterium]
MTAARWMMLLLLCSPLVACSKSGAKKQAPTPAPAGGAIDNLEAAPLVGVKTGPARIQIAELAKAVEVYKLTHNDTLPATLAEACPGGVPKDPWGTPYFYRVEGDKAIIWSAGPDRISGTADDVK